MIAAVQIVEFYAVLSAAMVSAGLYYINKVQPFAPLVELCVLSHVSPDPATLVPAGGASRAGAAGLP